MITPYEAEERRRVRPSSDFIPISVVSKIICLFYVVNAFFPVFCILIHVSSGFDIPVFCILIHVSSGFNIPVFCRLIHVSSSFNIPVFCRLIHVSSGFNIPVFCRLIHVRSGLNIPSILNCNSCFPTSVQ